ncbi:MAG TPA: Hsp20/alpha crystallin family protein [Pyrinomonadaceae bacterium]|nr:Hsp20/alpha crystallin family protein [Pyrinomonadaceae bacterium]
MANGWNPIRDLVTLQERMNRLFEEAAVRRQGPRDEEEEPRAMTMQHADWTPAADVFEDESEYVIALDLPGVERAALGVNLDEDRLTISGERRAGAEAPEGANVRRAERPAGRFARSFTLPTLVDRERITADYKDGVLVVRLPKRVEQQARRVEIKVQ